MATIKQAWGTVRSFTLTLASLASSATAGRESTAVTSSTDDCLDYICQVAVTLQTGSPANDKAVYVYLYGSVDGTNYTDNATGSDAAITLTDPTNMRIACIIPAPASGALRWESIPFSVAQVFGGILPAKWGIVVRNYTGLALSATEGDHFYKYQAVYVTTV